MDKYENNLPPLILHPVHNQGRSWEEVMNEQNYVETQEASLGYNDEVMLPNKGPLRRIPGTLHKNLFTVHSFNSDTNNLRQWLTRLSDSCGLPRVMPEFQPLMDDANYEDWSKVMNLYAKDISFKELNSDSMCLAHSIGCLFLIKYIAQNNIKIDTCAFLAGFLDKIEERDDINKVVDESFMPTEEEIEKFKENVKHIYAIYDTDDKLLNRPYQSTFTTEKFADHLGATKIVVEKGGHFGAGTGTTEIPELGEIIKEYSKRKDAEFKEFKKDCMDFLDFLTPNNSTDPIPVNGFTLYLVDDKKLNKEEKEKVDNDPTYCLVVANKGHNCVGIDEVATHRYYILHGYGEFVVNDRSFLVSAGDVVIIRPGDTFYYRNLADEDMPLILVERIEPKFDQNTFHHIREIEYADEPTIEHGPRR